MSNTMSQTPPPLPPFAVEYGRPAERPRTNGAAVASLVLGILGCVPIITGLLAMVLGIIGIRKTRDPAVGGKGLAIAGLILGIISVVGWSACVGLFGDAYLESKPAGMVAKQFLQAVSAGDSNGALADSIGFAARDIQKQSGGLAAYGPLRSVHINSFNLSIFNGQTTMHLGGSATFDKGIKSCTFELEKTGGVYKVTSYWVQ